MPHHAPQRKKTKMPPLTLAQLSVNAKHYAAMLDMLRHGVRYAMIVEDDAAFETGSKIVATVKNKTYDVLAKYPGSTGFNMWWWCRVSQTDFLAFYQSPVP